MIILYSILLEYLINTQAILDEIPIIFQFKGLTTYTPDIGGQKQNGYKLTLGYLSKQWLAIQFVTTRTQNDILLLKLNDFYTYNSNPIFSGHQITIQDYHKNSSGLFQDIENNKDISQFSYTQTKNYTLNIIRYLGNNKYQDWNSPNQKYSVQEICFYSSDFPFQPTTFQSFYKSCYSYEINNFYSKFVGSYLKTFNLNGYQTKIYGWIDGPYISDNIYFYQNSPLFSYKRKPALIIEIGSTNENLQDYYVYSPTKSQSGDYVDTTVNGFQNIALLAQFWNVQPSQQIYQFKTTSLRISFKRKMTTWDIKDRQLQSTFIFCLYLYNQGTILSDLTDKACQIVQLSRSYPSISVAENNMQRFILFNWLIIILILIL